MKGSSRRSHGYCALAPEVVQNVPAAQNVRSVHTLSLREQNLKAREGVLQQYRGILGHEPDNTTLRDSENMKHEQKGKSRRGRSHRKAKTRVEKRRR